MASEGAGAPAEVSVVEPTGAETLVFGRIAGKDITAVFRERHQFAPGQQIHLAPDLGAVHLFDKGTGQRI
jgi:multiple sugar transport system ATP-binding protein